MSLATRMSTDAQVCRVANAIVCGVYCACVFLVVPYCLKPQILYSSSSLLSTLFVPLSIIASTWVPPVLFVVLVLDALLNSFCTTKVVVLMLGGIIAYRAFADNTSYALKIMFLLIAAYPSRLPRKHAVGALAISLGIVCAITVVLFAMGELPDEVRYEHNVLRHSLGFTIGIVAGRNLSMVVLACMYCLRDRWKPIYPAILFCAATLVLTATDSRAAFIVVIMTLGGIVIQSAFDSFPRLPRLFRTLWMWIARVAVYAFPLLAGLSLVIALAYEEVGTSGIATVLNRLVSGRLYLWAKGLSEVGLTVLGSRSLPLSSLDNTYLYICIRFGLLFVVVLGLIYVVCSHRACRCALAGDSAAAWDLIFLTTLLVFGLMTPYMRNVANNFGILLLGYWLNHAIAQVDSSNQALAGGLGVEETLAEDDKLARAKHLKRDGG